MFYFDAPNVTDYEDTDLHLLHTNGKQLQKLQNHFGTQIRK